MTTQPPPESAEPAPVATDTQAREADTGRPAVLAAAEEMRAGEGSPAELAAEYGCDHCEAGPWDPCDRGVDHSAEVRKGEV